jgi:hypothetical protein
MHPHRFPCAVSSAFFHFLTCDFSGLIERAIYYSGNLIILAMGSQWACWAVRQGRDESAQEMVRALGGIQPRRRVTRKICVSTGNAGATDYNCTGVDRFVQR